MARQKRKGSFAIGMVIYAVVFLAITAAGLNVFWDFIDSYEQSRPKNTMDQYLAELTVEDMVDNCGEWAQQIDGKLQSPEEFSWVIGQSLTGKVTYARKSSVCTETSQTYVLRCGSQVIGETVIQASEPDRYGFAAWFVDQESFDFSHLMCEPQSVTVPKSYSVTANGFALSGEYITENGILYTALEEFYDDYPELPVMVTYTAGNILGELELTVLDGSGNGVDNWAEADPNTALDNCTDEETAMLSQYMEDFLVSYVRFTSGSNQSSKLNYAKLKRQFLIDGSDLANRLATALDGLAYAQSYNDRLEEVVVNRFTRIDDSRYFCDATYLVSTYGKAGQVQTTNNLKVMLVETDNGLRVEAMTRY